MGKTLCGGKVSNEHSKHDVTLGTTTLACALKM